MLYCEFCSYSNCKQCLTKTRLFPMAALPLSNKEQSQRRGKICKLCDRKFFIKALLLKTSDKIEAQNVTIENLYTQIDKAKQEKDHLEQQHMLQLKGPKLEKQDLKAELLTAQKKETILTQTVEKEAESNYALEQ